MAEFWWAFLIFGWVCGAVTALLVSSVVRLKRPRRCMNCGRRPRWAFDTTARDAAEIARDHKKTCLA